MQKSEPSNLDNKSHNQLSHVKLTASKLGTAAAKSILQGQRHGSRKKNVSRKNQLGHQTTQSAQMETTVVLRGMHKSLLFPAASTNSSAAAQIESKASRENDSRARSIKKDSYGAIVTGPMVKKKRAAANSQSSTAQGLRQNATNQPVAVQQASFESTTGKSLRTTKPSDHKSRHNRQLASHQKNLQHVDSNSSNQQWYGSTQLQQPSRNGYSNQGPMQNFTLGSSAYDPLMGAGSTQMSQIKKRQLQRSRNAEARKSLSQNTADFGYKNNINEQIADAMSQKRSFQNFAGSSNMGSEHQQSSQVSQKLSKLQQMLLNNQPSQQSIMRDSDYSLAASIQNKQGSERREPVKLQPGGGIVLQYQNMLIGDQSLGQLTQVSNFSRGQLAANPMQMARTETASGGCHEENVVDTHTTDQGTSCISVVEQNKSFVQELMGLNKRHAGSFQNVAEAPQIIDGRLPQLELAAANMLKLDMAKGPTRNRANIGHYTTQQQRARPGAMNNLAEASSFEEYQQHPSGYMLTDNLSQRQDGNNGKCGAKSEKDLIHNVNIRGAQDNSLITIGLPSVVSQAGGPSQLHISSSNQITTQSELRQQTAEVTTSSVSASVADMHHGIRQLAPNSRAEPISNNINVNMSLNFTITNNNQNCFERSEGSSAERSRSRKPRKMVGQRNQPAIKSQESRASSSGALAPFTAHLVNRPSRRNIKHISSGATVDKEVVEKLIQEEKRKSSKEPVGLKEASCLKTNVDLSQPKVLDRQAKISLPSEHMSGSRRIPQRKAAGGARRRTENFEINKHNFASQQSTAEVQLTESDGAGQKMLEGADKVRQMLIRKNFRLQRMKSSSLRRADTISNEPRKTENPEPQQNSRVLEETPERKRRTDRRQIQQKLIQSKMNQPDEEAAGGNACLDDAPTFSQRSANRHNFGYDQVVAEKIQQEEAIKNSKKIIDSSAGSFQSSSVSQSCEKDEMNRQTLSAVMNPDQYGLLELPKSVRMEHSKQSSVGPTSTSQRQKQSYHADSTNFYSERRSIKQSEATDRKNPTPGAGNSYDSYFERSAVGGNAKIGVSQDASDSAVDDRFLRSSSIMTKVIVKSDMLNNENFAAGVMFSPYQARQSSIVLHQEGEERPQNERAESILLESADIGLGGDGMQRHSTSFGKSVVRPADDSAALISSTEDLVGVTAPRSHHLKSRQESLLRQQRLISRVEEPHQLPFTTQQAHPYSEEKDRLPMQTSQETYRSSHEPEDTQSTGKFNQQPLRDDVAVRVDCQNTEEEVPHLPTKGHYQETEASRHLATEQSQIMFEQRGFGRQEPRNKKKRHYKKQPDEGFVVAETAVMGAVDAALMGIQEEPLVHEVATRRRKISAMSDVAGKRGAHELGEEFDPRALASSSQLGTPSGGDFEKNSGGTMIRRQRTGEEDGDEQPDYLVQLPSKPESFSGLTVINKGGAITGHQPPSRLSHFAASVGTETPNMLGRSDKSQVLVHHAAPLAAKSRDELLAEAVSSSGDYIFLVGKKNSMPHGQQRSGKKRARQFFSVCDEQTTQIIQQALARGLQAQSNDASIKHSAAQSIKSKVRGKKDSAAKRLAATVVAPTSGLQSADLYDVEVKASAITVSNGSDGASGAFLPAEGRSLTSNKSKVLVQSNLMSLLSGGLGQSSHVAKHELALAFHAGSQLTAGESKHLAISPKEDLARSADAGVVNLVPSNVPSDLSSNIEFVAHRTPPHVEQPQRAIGRPATTQLQQEVTQLNKLAYADAVCAPPSDQDVRGSRKRSAKTPKRGGANSVSRAGVKSRHRSPDELNSSADSAKVSVVDLTNAVRYRSIPVGQNGGVVRTVRHVHDGHAEDRVVFETRAHGGTFGQSSSVLLHPCGLDPELQAYQDPSLHMIAAQVASRQQQLSALAKLNNTFDGTRDSALQNPTIVSRQRVRQVPVSSTPKRLKNISSDSKRSNGADNLEMDLQARHSGPAAGASADVSDSCFSATNFDLRHAVGGQSNFDFYPARPITSIQDNTKQGVLSGHRQQVNSQSPSWKGSNIKDGKKRQKSSPYLSIQQDANKKNVYHVFGGKETEESLPALNFDTNANVYGPSSQVNMLKQQVRGGARKLLFQSGRMAHASSEPAGAAKRTIRESNEVELSGTDSANMLMLRSSTTLLEMNDINQGVQYDHRGRGVKSNQFPATSNKSLLYQPNEGATRNPAQSSIDLHRQHVARDSMHLARQNQQVNKNSKHRRLRKPMPDLQEGSTFLNQVRSRNVAAFQGSPKCAERRKYFEAAEEVQQELGNADLRQYQTLEPKVSGKIDDQQPSVESHAAFGAGRYRAAGGLQQARVLRKLNQSEARNMISTQLHNTIDANVSTKKGARHLTLRSAERMQAPQQQMPNGLLPAASVNRLVSNNKKIGPSGSSLAAWCCLQSKQTNQSRAASAESLEVNKSDREQSVDSKSSACSLF